MREDLDILKYLNAFKRKKFYFIIPIIAIFSVASIIILSLPPVYKSTATILIEAQEIPQAMVSTTVTGYVEERLQAITQMVLSRKNLLEIIKRFNLYPGLMKKYTTEEIIAKMRDAVSMKPIQASAINSKSGAGSATIAFSLSYEGANPKKTAQVANALLSFYLEENLRTRQEKAGTTYEFLETQLAELKKEIKETEKKVAEFKEEHFQSLPQLLNVNMKALDRIQREIDGKREFINKSTDQKKNLEEQLAVLKSRKYASSGDGNPAMMTGERLENLRSQYVALTADHSEKHPNVIKLKNQIKILEDELKDPATTREKSDELQDKQTQLSLLSEKYSEKHPDVVKLRKEVEAMLREEKEPSPKETTSGQSSYNPAYHNLETQIAPKEMEIRNAKKLLDELHQKHDDYQRRIEKTPRVEQAFLALKRDYAVAQSKYRDVQSRLQGAKEAKGLEESHMGEKFTVIELPNVPGKPYKPNRPALLLVSLILATGFGVGSGLLAEYMDDSIHDSEELADLSGLPVLTAIPYMQTSQEKAKRKKRKWVVFLGTALFIVAAALCVHFFYRSLGSIWLRFMH